MLTQALNNTADDGAEESVEKEPVLKTKLSVFKHFSFHHWFYGVFSH